MSLVMGKRPDLFTAYLHVSSKWDGEYDPVIEQELPVYFAIGRSDEYYGSEPTQEAYNTLYALYGQKGFSKEKIDSLLVLDIREHEYFAEQGISNEHGGGGSFAFDTGIMGWLFGTEKGAGHMDGGGKHLSGTVPEELEYIPKNYRQPSGHPGTLNKLTYQTWESFSYAESVDSEGLTASRDHRGFGGFSMGSVNTWCTFRYALDYFRYFMPMSGSYTGDGEYMAELVKESGHEWDEFFIFAASGTNDFAYSSFKAQIMAMGNVADKTFRFADNEADGNLSFLEREGYSHDSIASDEYTYNGLRFFWNSTK